MVTAINPDAIWPYVCKEDRVDQIDAATGKVTGWAPAPGATVFRLRVLRADEVAQIEDGFLDDVGWQQPTEHKGLEAKAGQGMMRMTIKQGEQKLRYLRAGLAGWDNFKDEEGRDAIFTTEGDDKRPRPTADTLTMMPAHIRDEVANAIANGQRASEDDRLKSGDGDPPALPAS